MEKIINFILLKFSCIKISNSNWEKLCQFVKFGFVGLSNTLISYTVYVFLIMLGSHYIVANILGFLVSVINAFYWNNKYVFKVEDGRKRTLWSSFCKTFISYAGTGVVINNLLLLVWVDLLGVHEFVGPIVNLFITIPLNFVLNKYWAFGKRK